MMSAPARACETAVRASSSSVASLSTAPAAAQHAAVAVVGVLAQAHVGDHEQVRVRLLDRARGELHDPLVVPGAGALGVLAGRDPEQQHRRDRRARRARRPRRRRGRSTAARSRASPRSVRGGRARGRRTSGRRSPPAESSVSRTRPRSARVARSLRMRVCGNGMWFEHTRERGSVTHRRPAASTRPA